MLDNYDHVVVDNDNDDDVDDDDPQLLIKFLAGAKWRPESHPNSYFTSSDILLLLTGLSMFLLAFPENNQFLFASMPFRQGNVLCLYTVNFET